MIENKKKSIHLFEFSFKADEIEYAPMVTNLNWFRHPAKPVPPQVVKVCNLKCEWENVLSNIINKSFLKLMKRS